MLLGAPGLTTRSDRTLLGAVFALQLASLSRLAGTQECHFLLGASRGVTEFSTDG